MRFCLFLLLLILSLSFLPTSNARALGYRGEDGNLSLRLGVIGSGTVEINNSIERDQRTALSFGSSYDASISDILFWGLNIDFHRMKWEGGFPFGTNQRTMLDISAGFKFRLTAFDGLVAFKPGIALGAGVLREISGVNDSRFLTIKVSADLVFYLGDQFGILIEGGMFTAPNGDDNVNNINIKPLPLFRVGLVY